MIRALRYVFITCLTAFVVTASAQAASRTWNNTGTDFNTAGSWTGGVPVTGDAAYFSTAATTLPDVSADISLLQLNFSTAASSGYELTSASGHAITLTATGTGNSSAIRTSNTSGTNTISVNLVLGAAAGTTQTFAQVSGGTLVINGIISGGSSTSILSLNGGGSSGLIKLTGNNTFLSNVEFLGTGSNISISSMNNLGAGSSIYFSSSANLKYTGAGETTNRTIYLNNASGGTIDTSAATGALILSGNLSGTVAGAKTLTLSGNTTVASEYSGKISDGTGTTSIKLASGKWILSGNNDFTGGVLLNNNVTLGIKSSTALGTGTFTISGSTFDNVSGSALTLTNNNAINFSASTATFSGTNDLNLGTGAVTVTSNLTLTVSGSTLTLGGDIASATNTLTKSGTGRLVLSGANNLTGKTVILGGTLQFAKRASLYNANTANWTSANIIVSSGATLAVNVGGTNEFTSSDVDALRALGATSTGFRSGSSIGFDTTNASGGKFTYGSNISNPNSGANALGVVKLGSGTLELTGSNTYTGATAVNSGTLLENGTSTGSAFTVNAATLGGHGTINGLVTTSGVTSILDADGTFTLAGGLNAAAGATFNYGLGSTPDFLNLGSGVFTGSTAANGLVFNFSNLGDAQAFTTYTLLTFGSSSDLDVADLLAILPSGWVLNTNFGTDNSGFLITSTSLQVQFAAVPEPSTWAMLIGSVSLLFTLARRQRRRA
jgi:autotransporter-associated beta strand protein